MISEIELLTFDILNPSTVFTLRTLYGAGGVDVIALSQIHIRLLTLLTYSHSEDKQLWAGLTAVAGGRRDVTGCRRCGGSVDGP